MLLLVSYSAALLLQYRVVDQDFCPRMNPQQLAQSRSSANGFNRRRGEKEIGTRVENKSQPGKSNFNKMTTAGSTLLPTCLVIYMLFIGGGIILTHILMNGSIWVVYCIKRVK